MKFGKFVIFLLCAFSLVLFSCKGSVDEEENNENDDDDVVVNNASGSDFEADGEIYINLTNVSFSSDNETYSSITSNSEIVSIDSTTTLLNVDLTSTEESIAVYISGTNDSSKIGGIRIQSYYDEETSEYYEVGIYLNGATIASTKYPCIYVTKGAPATFFLVDGTENVLKDGRTSSSYTEDAKGTLYCKNSITLCGSGSLSISQGFKNCIGTKGNLVIENGTYSLASTATPIYDSDEGDYNSPALINVDENIVVSGGTLTGTASGNYNKGIKCDGTYTQTDGSVNVSATGTTSSSDETSRPGRASSSSSSYPSAKGMRVEGAITISGGKLYASSKNDEGIESKSTITISGGEVYGYSTGDDAINSSGDMTISGGYVCGYSSANDGLDANGNMYIKGGLVYAVCTTTPEVALDANTEQSKTLYIQGGTIITLGPIESGASLSQNCYQASSWSANTNYGLTVGSTTYVFKTPSSTSGYGSGIIVSASSTPTLTSGASTSGGTSYFDGNVYVGGTAGSTNVSLSSYSSSSSSCNQPGGGGGRKN